MKRKIAIVAMIMAVAAVSCGGTEESSISGKESSVSGTHCGGDDADNAPQSFTGFSVRLDPATTAENVTPQIVSAARGQIAPICEEHPGASARILNPFDSDAYQDVPCSAILVQGEATGQAESPLTSDVDGPIGEAKQGFGPISFLMCGIFLGGATLYLDYVLCPKARTERDRSNCEKVGTGGGIALGILCSFPF